jgi:hypothetical protein
MDPTDAPAGIEALLLALFLAALAASCGTFWYLMWP